MTASPYIHSADKALTSLFEQYSADPSMNMGIRLSKALIARGHAAEALQITDYSLSLEPTNTEGRIYRAAALIELSRPKAAYVELQRILALDSGHRKAIRMLGQVYVDLGHSARAAQLLRKQMSQAQSVASSSDDVSDPTSESDSSTRIQVPAIKPRQAVDAQSPDKAQIPVIGDLFTSLTNDLGLGGFPNDFATETSKVEVTQVVRTRLKLKRSPQGTELTSLAGPIVDRSQSKQLLGRPVSRRATSRPSTPYDMVTSPELHHTWDEENNIQDNPFKVSPITGQLEYINDAQTIEGPPSKATSSVNTSRNRPYASNQDNAKTSNFLDVETRPKSKVPPYLKRFVKGTPVNRRPKSASIKKTMSDEETQSHRKPRFSLSISIIIALLAFGLGVLVASSNREPSVGTPPAEENTP